MPNHTSLRGKIREWLRCYLPSELLAIAAAYVGFNYAWLTTGTTVTAAYCAVIAETSVFYGSMLFRGGLAQYRRACLEQRSLSLKDGGQLCVNLFTELGISGLVDGFLIHPLVLSFIFFYG